MAEPRRATLGICIEKIHKYPTNETPSSHQSKIKVQDYGSHFTMTDR